MHLDDPDMQAFLDAHLEPGERVLWVGRPSRRAVRRRMMSGAQGGLFLLMLGACAALAGMLPGPMLLLLLLWGAVHIASECSTLADERSRWYVLTSRRVLSLSLLSKPFVLAGVPASGYTRRRNPDGSSDLIFDGATVADEGDDEPCENVAFYGVPDPEEVERLVAERDTSDGPPPTPAASVSAEVLLRIAAWLRSGHGGLQGGAVLALSQIGRPALPTLLEALGDDKAHVRAGSAEALSRIAGNQPLPQDAIEALVGATMDDVLPVRSAARKGLKRCGKAAVRPLVCCPRGEGHWEWRTGALMALTVVGVDAFAAGTLDCLLAGDQEFAECLRMEFMAADELPRRVVQEWSVHGSAGAEALLRVVTRGLEWAAVAAAEALTAPAIAAVRARLARLQPALLWNPAVAVVATAEASATSEAVREQLLTLLEAGEPPACLAAAVGLGFVGEPCGLPLLLPALQDDCGWVRYAAARAIGHLGGAAADALPELDARRRREEDGETRRALGGAIRQIRYAAQMAPTELMAASAPAGRGTELEPTTAPAGRGTELMQDEGGPEAGGLTGPAGREGTRG